MPVASKLAFYDPLLQHLDAIDSIVSCHGFSQMQGECLQKESHSTAFGNQCYLTALKTTEVVYPRIELKGSFWPITAIMQGRK